MTLLLEIMIRTAFLKRNDDVLIMGFRNRFKGLFKSDEKESPKSQNRDVGAKAEDEKLSVPESDGQINGEKSFDESFGENDVRTVRSFKYLEDLINSGAKRIVLDSDIVLGDDETQYSYGITLEVDGLVIDGNGRTIDACKKRQIFHVAGRNIEIRNVTFRGGEADRGGAIYNRGELTLEGCSFTSSKSKRLGGALFNSGDLTVEKCSFTSNRSMDSGGAIYNEGGTLNVKKSTFKANRAKNHGAAIGNDYISRIFSCEFLANKSRQNVIHNKDFLEVYNTTFADNHSNDVIFNHTSRFDRHLENDIEIGELVLGAFFCRFSGNSVKKSVIYNGMSMTCNIGDCIFEDNIYTDSSKNLINESEMTLEGVKIGDEGKSILNSHNIFIKGEASGIESKIEGEGKIEYVGWAPPNMFDFGYLDRKIHESTLKEIVLDEDICLERYEKDFYEGGIELDIDGMVIDGNGCTIDASGHSRIFIITGNDITLKNIRFINGKMAKSYDNPLNAIGGALRINHSNSVVIENCEFINNISWANGGAINNAGIVKVSKSYFKSNRVGSGKGSIYNEGELNIEDSKFDENPNGVHNEGNLNISGSDFENYSCHNNGICKIDKCRFDHSNIDNASSLHVMDCEFNGGFGTLRNSGKMSVNGCSFEKYGVTNDSLSDISNSIFKDNSSYSGGALKNTGDLKVFSCDFKFNSAQYGGAVDNDGDLKVFRSLFESNRAGVCGGAIRNDGNLAIEDCRFNLNESEGEGGAIFNHKRLEVKDAAFAENTSKKIGGAIFSLYEGEIDSVNCSFNANSPDDVYEAEKHYVLR